MTAGKLRKYQDVEGYEVVRALANAVSRSTSESDEITLMLMEAARPAGLKRPRSTTRPVGLATC